MKPTNNYLEVAYKHRARILEMAEHMGAMEPDEVRSEVYLRCLRQSNSDRVDKPLPWLRQVTRYTIYSLYRRSARNQAISIDQDLDQLVHEGTLDESSNVSERKESIERVRELVNELPCSNREIVVACWLDEEAVSDFAKRKQIPIETCRTRLKRARVLLRNNPRLKALANVYPDCN